MNRFAFSLDESSFETIEGTCLECPKWLFCPLPELAVTMIMTEDSKIDEIEGVPVFDYEQMKNNLDELEIDDTHLKATLHVILDESKREGELALQQAIATNRRN
ncbi:MAG: hypothetical protein ACXABD_22690 [Candidatus Thorarchaeota archaeon]|jgi:hypothetical protein